MASDDTDTQAVSFIKEWRCFFCDEVFITQEGAAEHFGVDAEDCCTMCQIKSYEGGLVKYIHELEREIHAYQTDQDPISQSFLDCCAEYERKLVEAEQKGYDKGVQDMKAQGLCPEPQKHSV